jgi:hypothetical protein
MSCCGQKREAMQSPRRTIPVLPTPPSSPAARPRTLVEFRGSGAYLVEGRHTRAVYRFSAQQPTQWIDVQDAEVLIRTGLFRARN